MERQYWRQLSLTKHSIYGADVSGTLTDPDVEVRMKNMDDGGW